MRLRGRVLSIAGSDCGGGAGIQADIKTITALGAYAATAITAVTVQDTRQVYSVHPVPPAIVAAQIACVLADPGADAIKTGMLVDAATIDAVIAALTAAARLPLVVDPVMRATAGAALLSDDALTALRRLCAQATIVTPNLAEAARLLGRPIEGVAAMRAAAADLLAFGSDAVLITGGHCPGNDLTDILASSAGITAFPHARIASAHTHGTGCTLAAAIATGLAQGASVPHAVGRAIAFVQDAIRAAPGFGAAHGPLNHMAWQPEPSAGG